MFEIIKPETKIDFISRRGICAALSAALIVAGLAATLIQGVKLGIDFAGGTEMLVRFESSAGADEAAIRSAVEGLDVIDELQVVRFGDVSEHQFLLRFKGDINQEVGEGETKTNDLVDQLAAGLRGAVGNLSVERVDFVGPRVGGELRRDGLLSLLFASLAILAYIAFRFSSRFAPGAIVAVLHDLLITAGIFVILGLEFDLRILAAMLAILGYSLNDTIIIYDRIRENMERRTKFDLIDVLNESVNQTLSRTVLTSGTTLLALLALLFLGGDVIRPFAFAMLIGVVVGTYSSVYIAAPTLLWMEERFAAK